MTYNNDYKDRPFLPDCWLDDTRMQVLFSPFRVRDINPDGWDLKMAFWINIVNKWCLSLNKTTFTIQDLANAFRRGDQYPNLDCLKLVTSQMKREQKLIFEEELSFRNPKPLSKKALDWTVGSLVKPFSLAWGAMNRDDSHPSEKLLPNINVDTVFFHKETLDSLLDIIPKWTQCLPPACERFEEFVMKINEGLFSGQPIETATLNVIIEALESKNILKTATESGIRIVKYGKDCKIQETDISIIKLDVAKETIQKEVTKLEEEILTLQAEARNALEMKNRDKAMLILKKKKRIEGKILDKETQIDNIDHLRFEITSSHSNQKIIEAFRIANNVLKINSNKLDEIENTVSEVGERLDDIATLNSELNRPFTENAAIDNDAEEELNELLKDIEEEKAAEAEKEKEKAAEAQKAAEAEKKKREREEEEAALMQQLNDITIIDSDISAELLYEPENPVLS